MTTSIRSASGERAATRRPASRRDGGFSFVEAVVTIVLMGIVIVPVLAAVRASIRVSAVSGDAAKAETAMINAADRINRAPMACNYLGYAQAAAQTAGWADEDASVSQWWYDPLATDLNGNGTLDPDEIWKGGNNACRFSAVTTDLVQKIRITITAPDHGVTRTIEVVKSNV